MPLWSIDTTWPSTPRVAWALLVAFAMWQPGAAAQTAEHVLVVANEASPASVQIADYYARKRSIPSGQMVRLRTPVAEEIDRTTYTRTIEAPT